MVGKNDGWKYANLDTTEATMTDCTPLTTPGPWAWVGNDLCAMDGHTTILKDVVFWNPDPGDKALIAASREMLDALEGLIVGVEAEVNEKGGGGFILARLTDARAAVAKAYGRERR